MLFNTSDPLMLAILAGSFLLCVFLGTCLTLRKIDARRAERARQSPAYQRAGKVEVLAGSPVDQRGRHRA